MGFSPLGLAVGLAVLAPTVLLLRFPPRTPLPRVEAPRLLGRLERAGQALCVVVPAVTAPGRITWWWVVPAGTALALYYALWLRYVTAGRDGASLYRPLLGLAVPMAVLPVAVFLATAAWLGNPWIAAAGVVLAAGHVPVALRVARAVSEPAEAG